jgi:hypothetical protein
VVDFDWWTSIQDVSGDTRARLSGLLAAAPPAAREWCAPQFRDDGLVARFRIPHLVMLAVKPG